MKEKLRNMANKMRRPVMNLVGIPGEREISLIV